MGSACAFYMVVACRFPATLDVGRRNAAALLRVERRVGLDIESRVQRWFVERPAALGLCNGLHLGNQAVLTPLLHGVLARRGGPASHRCTIGDHPEFRAVRERVADPRARVAELSA